MQLWGASMGWLQKQKEFRKNLWWEVMMFMSIHSRKPKENLRIIEKCQGKLLPRCLTTKVNITASAPTSRTSPLQPLNWSPHELLPTTCSITSFYSTWIQRHIRIAKNEACRWSIPGLVLVRTTLLTSRTICNQQKNTRTDFFQNSIVVSCFAIVILSVIGALFQANHHSMTGTKDDPENPKAVAATVFSAVIVYAVRYFLLLFQAGTGLWHMFNILQGFLGVLAVSTIVFRLSLLACTTWVLERTITHHPSILHQSQVKRSCINKFSQQIFLVGCSFQAYLHYRENRKGAIRIS